MFTIDLLKGRGIPIKSRPEGIAVASATIAVPVIITIVMFGYYLHTRIAMSIQKQRIVNYEAKIDELSDAVELQKSLEKKKAVYRGCLSEVSSAIGRHTQWSPILATLVKNMPDSMVLTELSVKQRSVRKKIPKKDDPEKTVYISVPARTLHISISGSPQYNCVKAVRDFRDRLRLSIPAVSREPLEDIKVSQQVGTLDGMEMVSYGIDCVFKPEF